MNELSKEKTMIVKEVADQLNCSEDTILRAAKELFPEIVSKGKPTYLFERHVTAIKLKIEKNYSLRNGAELPKTNLEKKLLIKQGYDLLLEEINQLQEQNKKLDGQVKRLVHDTKTYTTTEIAKELNLKSAQGLNNILEEKKIQYFVNGTWVLAADLSDKGYESIKQQELDNGKIIYNRHWTGKGRDFILALFDKEVQE